MLSANLHRLLRLSTLGLVLPLGTIPLPLSISRTARVDGPAETVAPNDNRKPAGQLRGGELQLRLVARIATWRPSQDVDSVVTVMTFAEEGGAPSIPGPLVRTRQGTVIRVSVRNDLPDSTLVVTGLRAGTLPVDTIHIAPGTVREVTFTAGAPGTYLYWGTTTHSAIFDRPWRDSQLTGAIVIDPRTGPVDPSERIFVITVLDLYPQDSIRNKAKENVWERAINGRSWPHNERVQHTVGDTVRWRWINGSYLPHPMHLHGFHFRVRSKGERNSDTTYARGRERTVVTEFMAPGTSFRMDWVPTRAGRWLMHCHMQPHVTPFPERPDSIRSHDTHDLDRHPLNAMAGLVLGVTVVDRAGGRVASVREPTQRLRVFAQQSREAKRSPRGFVLAQQADPPRDSVAVPGTPLILERGRTTAITVINRLRDATTVHWHGMELESVYDGVSGWSRTGASVAPMIAAGDSFVVTFTPPRAGTYIYHTHMDEEEQLSSGMYAPLIVLAPGQRWNPSRDLVFMFGNAVIGDSIHLAINGSREPASLQLRAGTRYRLRFINIHPAGPATMSLQQDSTDLTWKPLAKDGADVNGRRRAETPARLTRFGVGETYDFEWTPPRAMNAVLSVNIEGKDVRQAITVRP